MQGQQVGEKALKASWLRGLKAGTEMSTGEHMKTMGDLYDDIGAVGQLCAVCGKKVWLVKRRAGDIGCYGPVGEPHAHRG